MISHCNHSSQGNLSGSLCLLHPQRNWTWKIISTFGWIGWIHKHVKLLIGVSWNFKFALTLICRYFLGQLHTHKNQNSFNIVKWIFRIYFEPSLSKTSSWSWLNIGAYRVETHSYLQLCRVETKLYSLFSLVRVQVKRTKLWFWTKPEH